MKVSVSLVTYQHAQTARQAIDSVLMQETDFDVEVLIGDDASQDGTQEILKSYHSQPQPHRVRIFLRQQNAGDAGLSNVVATLDAAQGEYIAFLDGDDYWTDPQKLQQQADFLDAHPDCSLCTHRVQHLHNTSRSILSPNAPQGAGCYDVGALILRNFSPKISTMLRRSALEDLPSWYRSTQVASADWLLNVLVGRHGQIGFLDQVMAVHRIHSASVMANHGAVRMLSDKLAAIPLLQDSLPEKRQELLQLRSQLLWKRRAAQWTPRVFQVLKRLNDIARPQPRT